MPTPQLSLTSLSPITSAQQNWLALEYGMFVHFGPNTIEGKAWGDGVFQASNFAPQKLNCRQWVGVAAEAGMKYAVLTTKHHDGFCLWPSRFTDYSVKNSPLRRDIVGEFVEACSQAGVKAGFYYSLWDRNCPFYDDDAAYAEYMRSQIEELLSSYGDVVELWFDGGWDKEHPTREWPFDPAWKSDPQIDKAVLGGARWEWKALYSHVKKIQPDCVVLNNSGSDRPGIPRCFPLDARTSEHFDFIFQEKLFRTEERCLWRDDNGQEVFLPLEYTTSLNPHWFHTGSGHYLHPSAYEIAGWKERARKANANLLLNVGPDQDGLIPDYHLPFLLEANRLQAAFQY